MHLDSRHVLRTGDSPPYDESDERTSLSAAAPVVEQERGRAEAHGPRHALEIIAAGRPLPDIVHALCKYLETAAADWERKEVELKRSEAELKRSEAELKRSEAFLAQAQ